jgi:hypothetical protein
LVAQKTGSHAEMQDFRLKRAKFEDLLELSGSSIQKEIAQAKLLKDL